MEIKVKDKFSSKFKGTTKFKRRSSALLLIIAHFHVPSSEKIVEQTIASTKHSLGDSAL